MQSVRQDAEDGNVQALINAKKSSTALDVKNVPSCLI